MNGRAEVSRLRKRLDATFARIPATGADLEVQSDYAKYLCILVSGFFENAIVALLLDYVERRSSPEVMSYVEGQLERWTNPNTEKITTLFGAFSTDWRVALTDYLVDQRKDSVNSLLALRHKIAHGESVGTSLSQVKAHYKVILEISEFLSDLVDPSK
ncbi:MAG: HEPN domain-containing protein [Thermoanaerobaculia bacterium]